MNIRTQSEAFIENLKSRRRNPIKPRTIAAYSSYLRSWINPLVGQEELSQFENGAMKRFVAKLAEAELSAATTVSIVNCLKGVIGSALDENGNELYPRKWNNDFVDLPIVGQREQEAPTIDRETLQEAISGSQGLFKPLYITLAATGLRIGECLALRAGLDDSIGSFWLPERELLVIRGQLQDGRFLSPKTAAGFREVDISANLNKTLKELSPAIGKYIFDVDFLSSYRTLREDGIPGYHSLRRFRVTRLREVGTPEDILKFWIGHGSKDISDRYSKLAQNTVLRKEWAERAGLGFSA